MKSLTFCFSTQKSIISALIRFRTNSEISHVDVVSPEGYLLIGARLDGGFQGRPLNYSKFTKMIKVTIPVTDEQYDKFWAFTEAQIGKPYDKTAIFGLAAHRDWREDDSWFCSEEQSAALEAAGVMNIVQKCNWVDPQSLMEMLMVLPGAVQA